MREREREGEEKCGVSESEENVFSPVSVFVLHVHL